MRPTPRSLLAAASVPALLITDPVNIRYLTGLSLDDGIVVVSGRSFLLYVDALEREAAVADARGAVTIRDRATFFKDLKNTALCGFEGENVTIGTFRHWKKHLPNTKFVRVGEPIEEFRRQKDDSELALMRRARRITEEMLRRVPASLRSGVTEKALAWKLEGWARELGADGLAFPPIVAFGTHTSRPHHRPTTRALQKGHIVQIDVGAVYHGYCADLSRVYFTSPLTRVQERAYRAVTEAKDAAVEMARAGKTNWDVANAGLDVLKKYRLHDACPHALGHGVGLAVHEGVVLSPSRPKKKLLAGEVLAIEPGVYFPGKFGMRVEDMAVIA